MKKDCALYIHIPFCVSKCQYCDFLSMAAGETLREQYIDALLHELESWGEVLGRYRLCSIFIGGGTPTCLSPALLEFLVQGISKVYSRLVKAEQMEYTIEANPGTVVPEHLPIMESAGINRVSLGLQSAQNRELQALGRIHSYEVFLQTYDMMREYGFSNINIDLMSDIPYQTLKSYEDTLQKVTFLQPEHISAYSLIVEEGTPFYELEEEGKLPLPSEETDRLMYHRTREILAEKGYVRYEISNYAQPGYSCRHNLVYWDTGEYLGIGLGASSCLAGYRFRNTNDMSGYLSYFNRKYEVPYELKKKLGQPVFKEVEHRTEKAAKEEFMFLGLRKMAGVSMKDFKERFGEEMYDIYGTVIAELSRQNLLGEKNGRIFLTERGIDVSNTVLSKFLLD